MKIGKNLAGVLAIAVIAVLILDALLIVTSPWWMTSSLFSSVDQYVEELFYSVAPPSSYPVMMSFIIVCGLLLGALLVEAARILMRIRQENPFCWANVRSLQRAAIYIFALSVVFFVKIFLDATLLTIIGCVAFVFGGIFLLVVAELFRAATRIREDNELTI